jgi:hypothetical protein
MSAPIQKIKNKQIVRTTKRKELVWLLEVAVEMRSVKLTMVAGGC